MQAWVCMHAWRFKVVPVLTGLWRSNLGHLLNLNISVLVGNLTQNLLRVEADDTAQHPQGLPTRLPGSWTAGSRVCTCDCARWASSGWARGAYTGTSRFGTALALDPNQLPTTG